MNMLAKLVVRLYEKLRKWCYESLVDRLKRGRNGRKCTYI